MDPSTIKPEDCPDPGWHQTHYYCPCCSWTSEEAPKSPQEQRIAALEASLVKAGVQIHEEKERADRLAGENEKLRALLREALPIVNMSALDSDQELRERIEQALKERT